MSPKMFFDTHPYSRHRTSLGLPLVFLVLGLAGCGESTSTSTSSSGAGAGVGAPVTRVAVVDLDRVAKETGLLSNVATSVDQAKSTLNQQLAAIQTNLKDQVQKQAKELTSTSGSVDADLETRLALLEKQANVKLQAVAQEAKQKLSAHTSGLIQQLRVGLGPVVRQVAAEEDIDMVLTTNPQVVFLYSKEADISDLVIQRVKEIQARASKGTPKPAASAAPPAMTPASQSPASQSPAPRSSAGEEKTAVPSPKASLKPRVVKVDSSN